MSYKSINNRASEYLSINLESQRVKKKAHNTMRKDELRPPKCRIKNTEHSFIVRQ